ncbi:MAG TPA: hypothetical protein VG986_07750 [Pseudolabrys sp.]|nr:hypothetical protein [Pseudolabrys sp.]
MQMIITNITCNQRHSTTQDDNVFLLIQADAGVPARYPLVDSEDMGNGSTMTLPDGGYVVNFDYGVVVTGWDLDSRIFTNVNAPDFLFNFSVNSNSASYSGTMSNENGAKYSYSYTISQ